MGSLPTGTSLPSGTSLPVGTSLPSGTSLPAGGAAAPSTPLTIISSVTVLAWLRADLGITIGTGVSAWATQFGAATFDHTQATGGLQPAFSATGGPNGTPIVSTDGIDDRLISTYTPAAPATTPHWIWLIARRDVAAAANNPIYSASNASSGIYAIREASATTVTARNGVTSSALAWNAGEWRRVEAAFSNSAAIDYLKVGANTTGIGASFGNSPGAAPFQLGALGNGTLPCTASFAEILITQGPPSAGEINGLDAYVLGRYGAGLT